MVGEMEGLIELRWCLLCWLRVLPCPGCWRCGSELLSEEHALWPHSYAQIP